MIHYFAYGSNMVRERIEERVGAVRLRGVGRVMGYTHSFSKLGRDGTGKGNIQPARSSEVYGVVYWLTSEQMAVLQRIEGGYEPFTLGVDLSDGQLQASSFRALQPVEPLCPTREYVAWYERGMRENQLPGSYCRMVLEQARFLGVRV